MATSRQVRAARRNVKAAQAAWKGMTKRARALAQPQGRSRRRPGAGGGDFYRIEVRPKREFTSFRTQDVGRKGGLERIAGRRSSGSWGTATWLVSKKDATRVGTHLVVTGAKAKTVLKSLGGPITWVKGDVFKASPRANVPEAAKPTPAQRRARSQNIKKAQVARRKR